MIPLIITVILAISISAICSTMEAMLYSLPWTQVEKMRESGSAAGRIMAEMRGDIQTPISAILTLNTIANTAGASIAGALAANALGAGRVPAFAVFFTVLVLLLGEIIPKTIGVIYCVPLAKVLAHPLNWLVRLLKPFTWASGLITRSLTPEDNKPEATEDDILAMARLSFQSGSIQKYEETVIRNILSLDQKRVHDVMTPRTVVFSLPASTPLEEAYADPKIWHFSRIPVYEADNEDIVGLASRRDISRRMDEVEDGVASGLTLADLMTPIHFVLESQSLDKLLTEFLEVRQHLFAVLDEYGGLAGVISLEDVLEEMLGREIVDESDAETDMREAARKRRNRALQAAAQATGQTASTAQAAVQSSGQSAD